MQLDCDTSTFQSKTFGFSLNYTYDQVYALPFLFLFTQPDYSLLPGAPHCANFDANDQQWAADLYLTQAEYCLYPLKT